ncbi:tripartite tricarboxylate transporter substrate binding protein [Hydrogenophaga sp. 2FB]|uniref:Bug family tripartite tricarboxylate transporter substrate binding protein n=1 Tax=Hydrogenophaga sp. 2FB TaxID=2502187 RepID=UPI0010F932EC|nr:tripartite tricarboxylate transporter substrate binding protein [Hydrogenophaga sp. 2FB]
MNASLRRVFFAAALSFTVAVGSTAAWAQASYPAKPITLVVAYPAGGDTDALARLLAEKLSTRVGQPVIVDNRPGASGTIGSAYVSRAAADGYTLLLAPSTLSIAQFVMKTTGTAHYDVLKGFTPIVQTGAQSLALVVGPGTSARSPKELVAEARRSGPVGYATPGAGSPMHIAGELFNRSAGVKLNHVPYKGVAPAINDVLGGHVASTFITLGPVLPNIASGKLAILAIADDKRSPLTPSVPTLLELGYKNVEVKAWTGLFGPRGLPAGLVQALNTHINAILQQPDTAEKMAAFGMLPAGGGADVLEKTNATDFARYGKLIQELRIQAE